MGEWDFVANSTWRIEFLGLYISGLSLKGSAFFIVVTFQRVLGQVTFSLGRTPTTIEIKLIRVDLLHGEEKRWGHLSLLIKM